MDLTLIMKLISVVLALSLASERLVTFLKTIIPPLAGPQPPSTDPENTIADIIRKAVVMLIAFFASWYAASYLTTDHNLLSSYPLSQDGPKIPYWILALMSSGGSAFWTNILAYFKAVKDIKAEQTTQEKFATRQKIAAFAVDHHELESFRLLKEGERIDKKPVVFRAEFSGEGGEINVNFEDGFGPLRFDQDGSQTLELPVNVKVSYSISGAASADQRGSVKLFIETKGVISNAPHIFGPGLIFPNWQFLIVT